MILLKINSMKALLKFVSLLSISVLFYDCGEKVVKCKPFEDKYAMFIPQNMESNDSITFYNNKGDSLSFIYLTEKIFDGSSTGHSQAECRPFFCAVYKSKYHYKISQTLLYYGGSSNIQVLISYRGYDSKRFTYNPKTNPITTSKPMEDVLVNGVYYKDVVILDVNTFKIYVAKDHGVIMFTDFNEVWAINKFE